MKLKEPTREGLGQLSGIVVLGISWTMIDVVRPLWLATALGLLFILVAIPVTKYYAGKWGK